MSGIDAGDSDRRLRIGFLAGLWTAVIVGFVAWVAYGSILNFVSTTISLALVFSVLYGLPELVRVLNLRRDSDA